MVLNVAKKKKPCGSSVQNTQWHSVILIGLKFIRVPTKEIITVIDWDEFKSLYRYMYIHIYMLYIYIIWINRYMYICTEHNQGFGFQMTSSTTRRTCLWWWSVLSHPSQPLPGGFLRGLYEQKSPGFHVERFLCVIDRFRMVFCWLLENCGTMGSENHHHQKKERK